MKIRILSLCSIILVFLAALRTADWCYNAPLPQSGLKTVLIDRSAENILAIGLKLKISKLNRSDIEILPGLTETAKIQLLQNKQRIIAEASKLPEDKQHQVLIKIEGLGIKKADILADLLALD